MTDPRQIAERYIALWNEADTGTRRELFVQDWAADATYVDPLMAGSGTAEIDGLVAGVKARFPSFAFRLIGNPDGHGDHIRFSWTLGPGDFVDAPIEGTDIVLLREGRIQSVTGFLDRMPQM